MIWARPYYSPAQHVSAKKQVGLNQVPLPVTDKMVGKFMILPFGHTVSIEDISKICAVLSSLSVNGDAINKRLVTGGNL